MRFKQYLQEESKFDLEKFKKDCSFILGELKGTGGSALMLRGSKDKNPDFEIAKWVPRDGPRNTPIAAHRAFNELFDKKFGVKARDWMFATGRHDSAEIYSGLTGPNIIFPIGKFEWLSCTDINDRFYDLTVALSKEREYIKNRDVSRSFSYDEIIELATKYLVKQLDEVSWTFNTDLVKCINYGAEIMFKCERYYAFNQSGDVWNSEEMRQLMESL